MGEQTDVVMRTHEAAEETGTLNRRVVSAGTMMGDKLFAVPWKALMLVQDQEHFLLDVDKEVLENAPRFDKDSWPDFSDPSWGQGIHDHCGTSPYWKHEGRQGAGAMRG